MKRIGVFGGTFDPIHVGHLDVAEAARRALALDEVLLMPANVPPHRAAPRASAPHRFAMAALAIAGRQGLALLDLEMLSQEPSYTSTTLDRLALRPFDRLTAAPSNVEGRLRSEQKHGLDLHHVYLITGADAFHDITSWKDYPALLDRCHFVVVSRPDCSAASLPAALPELADRMISPWVGSAPTQSSIVLVDAPTAPVSATEIRRRAARGESIAGMVPELVAQYIQTHRLYIET